MFTFFHVKINKVNFGIAIGSIERIRNDDKCLPRRVATCTSIQHWCGIGVVPLAWLYFIVIVTGNCIKSASYFLYSFTHNSTNNFCNKILVI